VTACEGVTCGQAVKADLGSKIPGREGKEERGKEGRERGIKGGREVIALNQCD